MVHTLPPWTTKYRMVKIFGNIDDAELAARLGSINTFDRRGKIIYLEDFEAPTFYFREITQGDGADIYLVAQPHKTGSQSLKMITGDSTDDDTEIRKMLQLCTTTRIGHEISFAFDSLPQFLRSLILIYDGSKRYWFGIWYDTTNELLQYGYTFATRTTFATNVKMYASYYNWSTLKFVIDYATKKYVRCIFNETEYNLSAYSGEIGALVSSPRLECHFGIRTTANASKTVYVDDIIITQNEE